MNKTLEYMAYELPVVAFDLHETRVSAGGAAVYAEPNRVDEYARSISSSSTTTTSARMGAVGRGRIEAELAWVHQRTKYVDVYDALLRQAEPAPVERVNCIYRSLISCAA